MANIKYDPKSSVAEEFINDQEILDTIEYAKANKSNRELIFSLIERAKDCKGLTLSLIHIFHPHFA